MADPTWLPDVLRAAGLRCEIYGGAMERGHGDFGDIWGVVIHHTGASGSPGPGPIAQHPVLGLASQLHLSRNGVYTLCGVGIAYHAGAGAWPGLPTNDANRLTIGIEAENSGTEGWSTAQYNAYVTGVAAILRRLGKNAKHVIGHKEWAGPAQGKWDPGGIDMPTFRSQVQAQLDQWNQPKGTDVDQATADRILRTNIAILDQLAGKGVGQAVADGEPWPNPAGWPQGGNRSLYDLAAATAARDGVPGTADTKAAK